MDGRGPTKLHEVFGINNISACGLITKVIHQTVDLVKNQNTCTSVIQEKKKTNLGKESTSHSNFLAIPVKSINYIVT